MEEDSSLLSRAEQSYYNYVFNKAQYANGLDIRNTYAHVTPPKEEEQIWSDYAIALHALLLIVIKINEEFCLAKTKNVMQLNLQID